MHEGAGKDHGYETAEYLGVYHGDAAYGAVYRDDEEIYYIVFPVVILDKSGEPVWIQGKESLRILDYFGNEI